jgi:endonuclease/exonuclease/phosphatase family metal-dependent hydrolase
VGTNIATWGEYSVTGAIKWACTTFGRLPTPSNAPQINAGSAAGVAEPSEDWLISPSLDLSAFSGPTLDFWSRTRFAGAPLTLKVSTNYTTGDPNTASWSDLPATFPAENSDVWTETKEIDLTAYKGTNTRIAFVYTATSTAGARWTLDDIKIYNKAPQIVLTKAQTLDMVTWNLEWFGDATNGPTDETLQRNNIKTVIEQIDADLYCLQEVTNQNGLNNFQALVTDLAPLGYTGVRVTHSSSFGDAQQARAFIYKTSVFSNVTTQVLPLTGFVDNRQPVLFKGDATIEGTTKTVNVINIHAKATATGTETADFTTRQSNSVALKTYLDANLGTQNVVFLGDFNDDLDVSVVTPNPSPYKNFVDDVAGYATPSKTELSDKNITTFIGRTEPIDHIVLSNEMSALMYAGSLRREDYTSVITNYANTTSDHYPVSVRFQLGPVTPDATAPTFTATYPKVSNITNFDFKIESAINEAGKSYYVVVPDGASAPTALQVKSGQNASGAQVTANFRGAITHNAANVPSIVTITGIALLTDYDVYVVAEDIIPNLQASPMKIDVTAAPADIVPPIFTAGYPKADQITSISFRAVSSLNEAGKTYFIVLPNNASAPTSAQVKAGTNSSDVAVSANFKGTITNTTASTDFTANIIGTVDNVDYDVYFVAEDGFNNLQLAPVKVDLKTVTSAEDDITRYLSVYPNPAQHALTVRLMQNPLIQKGAVRLVNVMGQGVQQGNLTTRNEVSEHTFDVSSLPAGVYILELSEGKRKFFYKVVVR